MLAFKMLDFYAKAGFLIGSFFNWNPTPKQHRAINSSSPWTNKQTNRPTNKHTNTHSNKPKKLKAEQSTLYQG